MMPEERQIKAIFFQAWRMNIYESELALVVSLADAISAAVDEEKTLRKALEQMVKAQCKCKLYHHSTNTGCERVLAREAAKKALAATEVPAEQETVARLLDALHTIISIGCDYDNARTADELKKVIDDLVEIASRAHSGESIYNEPDA